MRLKRQPVGTRSFFFFCRFLVFPVTGCNFFFSFFNFPPRHAPLGIKRSVLADLQGRFAGAAEHFHVAVHPGNHVAGHVRRAVGQAHDVDGPQNSVPHVELAQLAHEGLSGVEAAADYVLFYFIFF